jgi:hypothetical protein
MRIEDVGGKYMFKDEGEDFDFYSDIYVNQLVRLVNAMRLDHVIEPVFESSLMEQATYNALADKYADDIEAYLTAVDLHFETATIMDLGARLSDIGFKGDIPNAQRQHYYAKYSKLYPLEEAHNHRARLAKYLASTLARYKLGGGGQGEWTHFLKMQFHSPVPGAPLDVSGTNFYMRTVLAHDSRHHVAPWRALGYLRVHDDGRVTPAVASQFEHIDGLIGSSVVLTESLDDDPANDRTVRIYAPYVHI